MWIQSSVRKHYKKWKYYVCSNPTKLYFFDLTLRQDIALIDAFLQIVCFSEMYFVGNWCKNEVFVSAWIKFSVIFVFFKESGFMSVKESPWSEGKVFKNFKRPRRLEKFIQETYMDMWWAWGCILISLTLELDSP